MGRFHILAIVAILGTTTMLAGCLTSANDPRDLSAAWDNGIVTLPASALKDGYWRRDRAKFLLPKLTNELKQGVKLPVIVWAHGCTGLSGEGSDFMALVADIGFAVVAPSSLHRPSRNSEPSCNTDSFTNIGAPYDLRLAEVRDAYKHILTIPWADKNNIFLAGFSEGGTTVSRYDSDEFRGIIILGTNCGGYNHQGVSAPSNVPVLVIYGDKDEWSSHFEFHCDVVSQGGPSKLLRIENGGHSVINYKSAREAITSFLTALRDN